MIFSLLLVILVAGPDQQWDWFFPALIGWACALAATMKIMRCASMILRGQGKRDAIAYGCLLLATFPTWFANPDWIHRSPLKYALVGLVCNVLLAHLALRRISAKSAVLIGHVEEV